jgi:hypothetical protein
MIAWTASKRARHLALSSRTTQAGQLLPSLGSTWTRTSTVWNAWRTKSKNQEPPNSKLIRLTSLSRINSPCSVLIIHQIRLTTHQRPRQAPNSPNNKPSKEERETHQLANWWIAWKTSASKTQLVNTLGHTHVRVQPNVSLHILIQGAMEELRWYYHHQLRRPKVSNQVVNNIREVTLFPLKLFASPKRVLSET